MTFELRVVVHFGILLYLHFLRSRVRRRLIPTSRKTKILGHSIVAAPHVALVGLH